MDGRQQAEGRWGTWVIGTPAAPDAHPANQQTDTWVAIDRIPTHSQPSSNTRHINYSIPPFAPHGPSSSAGGSGSNSNSNAYVHLSPVPGSPGKRPIETIFKVLGRCGKKLGDTTGKAGGVAENVWNHRSLKEPKFLLKEGGVWGAGLGRRGHDEIF